MCNLIQNKGREAEKQELNFSRIDKWELKAGTGMSKGGTLEYNWHNFSMYIYEYIIVKPLCTSERN